MVTSGETTEGLTHCPGMRSSGPCSRCGPGLVSGTAGSCWRGRRWVLTEAEGSERFCPETQAVWLPGAAMTVVWDSLQVSELRPGVRPQAASSMCLVSEFPPVPRWGHTAPPPPSSLPDPLRWPSGTLFVGWDTSPACPFPARTWWPPAFLPSPPLRVSALPVPSCLPCGLLGRSDVLIRPRGAWNVLREHARASVHGEATLWTIARLWTVSTLSATCSDLKNPPVAPALSRVLCPCPHTPSVTAPCSIPVDTPCSTVASAGAVPGPGTQGGDRAALSSSGSGGVSCGHLHPAWRRSTGSGGVGGTELQQVQRMGAENSGSQVLWLRGSGGRSVWRGERAMLPRKTFTTVLSGLQ